MTSIELIKSKDWMDQAFSYNNLVMSNANTFQKARQPVAQHGGRLMPSLFESYDLGPIRLNSDSRDAGEGRKRNYVDTWSELL
jgi:hypothetical protein